MKTLFHSLLASLVVCSTATAGSFFGGGPFNNAGYWPGYLNGKYMGVVTGNNIFGVLGFAITDGAPPFRVNDQQSSAGGAIQSAALVNQVITPDVLQNYFTIFVEGRTYFGLTTAGIDLDSSTVAGALQGQAPAGLPDITVTAAAAGNATVDALSVLNRGLSGGFTANINSKKATFTFSGTGQLSTPANKQTITATAVPTVADNLVDPLVPPNTITNEVISGRIVTETTDFNLSGIRTSFNANNPAALQDAQDLQGGGGGN
jgi:hypothetical protein